MVIQMSSLLQIPTLFPPPQFSPPATANAVAVFPFTAKLTPNLTSRKKCLTAVYFQNGRGGAVVVGEDLPPDYADWHPKEASDSSSRRRAGVLLHPTSFPGPYGIGDLGPRAFRFLDWLHLAGCSVWQVYSLQVYHFKSYWLLKLFPEKNSVLGVVNWEKLRLCLDCCFCGYFFFFCCFCG